MTLFKQLNKITQDRHNDFADHRIFLPEIRPVARLIKGFYPQMNMLGLHALPIDPEHPGQITLSNRGTTSPECWLHQILDTAWDLLSTRPSKHWTFSLREIRQNKSVPYDYVHWVYEEAGHPLTFIIEELSV